MWDWLHRTGYGEDHYDETGLSTEKVLEKIKNTQDVYMEHDIIILQNPNPPYDVYEFQRAFRAKTDIARAAKEPEA